MIPNQAMAADFHMVGLREADNLISLLKIECAFVPPNGPPFHRVLRFDHVEFATESLGVRSFGQGIRPDSSTHQKACSCGGLAQRCGRCRSGPKKEREKAEKQEQPGSCHVPYLAEGRKGCKGHSSHLSLDFPQ